jgi:hypothetical protein
VDAGDPAAPTVTAVPDPPRSRSEQARRSAYRSRFVVVYFCLAVAVGVAIGALAVALGSPTKHKATPGKVFESATTGELGAMDLAYDVQRAYQLPGGRPLTKIVASRNTLQDGQGGFFRVRFQVLQPADALKDRDSRPVVPDDPIQFSLCGEGAQCSIPGGASTARGSLLRRAGLELALRTFRRDTQVDNVTVFLRPFAAKEGWEGVALVFDRGKISHDNPALLSQPLSKTLQGAVGQKITPTQITPDLISKINELTQPFAYYYRYTLVGGRDALIQLEPVPGSA